MRESVSRSVHPENLVKTISKTNRGKIHPILAIYVLGLIDVLIRFWRQKIKVTAGNDPKNRVNAFVTIRANFLRSHMYLGLKT